MINKRVGLNSYVGFCLSSVSLLHLLNPNLRVFGVLVTPSLVGFAAAAIVLGIACRFNGWVWLNGDLGKAGIKYWFATVVACVAAAASTFLSIDQIYPYVGVGSFILLISIILAWRVHAVAYLALAIAVGIVIGEVQHDWKVGLGVFLFVATAMASCYWVLMLIVDHRLEGSRLIERWKRSNHPLAPHGISPFILLKAAAIWLPALLLSGAGLMIHNKVQSTLKRTLYEGEYVTAEKDSPPLTREMIEKRDIEQDWVRNIDEAEEHDKRDFVVGLQLAYEEFDSAARQSKGSLSENLEENKPKGLSDRPCEKMAFKIFKKNVASSRSGCKDLVADGNRAAKDRYAKLQENVNRIAEDTYEKGKSASAEKRVRLEQDALQLITEEYEAYRFGVRRGFQLIELLRLVGNLALIGALFAGYQMVLGRMLFDSEDPEAGFQLAPGGKPEPIEFTTSNKRLNEKTQREEETIVLRELTWEEADPRHRMFYAAYADVSRYGAKSDVCAPQWWNSFLQRLLTNRLMLTRINPEATYTTWKWRGIKLERESKPTDPFLSVPGDSHLVAIRLKPDQELHFRMADLAAFSDGVNLCSIYSTHVAGYLLGLGNFQCVATGVGYLILKSTGKDVSSPSAEPVPSSALLAWDRRANFTLHQDLTIRGIWLNDPDLIMKNSSRCAVLDQGTQSLGFFRKLWRMIRYLFLPV